LHESIAAMNFGFMAYYPADNLQLPVCTAWKEISTCGLLSGNHKGCDIYIFLNSSHVNTLATLKLVKDNCKAFGNCLKNTLIKTWISNLVYTTRFWNNLHQARSSSNDRKAK
jgi:hypothetical protein